MTENQYSTLLNYTRTLPIPAAHWEGQQLRNAAIYVHYCRRAAIEPFVVRLADSEHDHERFVKCLNRAKAIKGDGEEWTLVYVGIAAALESGRLPGDRFDHEFALCGYFRQAPALESLFLVLQGAFDWTTRCSNPEICVPRKLNIVFEHGRNEFLEWCSKHVRCGWNERPDFPRTRAECGRLLRSDERCLIKLWSPLLNVQQNRVGNDLCEWLTKERRQFRQRHMTRLESM